MKRLLQILFSFLLLNFFLVSQVEAANIDVVCPDSSTACSKSSEDPLFSISADGYWYPGRTITKTINLKNASSQTREMAIRGTRTSTIDILENVMNISIVGGTTVIWSGSVDEFYGQDKIGMGIFAPDANLDYDFTVSMSSGAGNDYQGKETVFDLTLGFWGEPAPTPTPTTTSAPTPTSASGEVLGAGVSASVCSDSEPNAPTNLTATAGVGQVTLSWTAPATPPSYTYFLVAYSDNNVAPKWGNPNVGTGTSYTVSSLDTGTYYFWVRAGNGCKPGDFVGPESATIETGAQEVELPAPGFEEGVLGEATPEGELLPPPGDYNPGETLGEEDESEGVKNLWLYLFIGIFSVFGLGLFYWRRVNL